MTEPMAGGGMRNYVPLSDGTVPVGKRFCNVLFWTTDDPDTNLVHCCAVLVSKDNPEPHQHRDEAGHVEPLEAADSPDQRLVRAFNKEDPDA